MAYFIFDQNNSLTNIAKNDSDKDSLNRDVNTEIVKDVSDSDANSVILGESTVSFDGTNVTVTPVDTSVQPDVPDPNYTPGTTNAFEDQTGLKNYIDKCVFPAVKDFVDNNPNNSMYSGIKTYHDYLQNIDYSSITFPISVSWEKYCNDNGITFYHPLQIP